MNKKRLLLTALLVAVILTGVVACDSGKKPGPPSRAEFHQILLAGDALGTPMPEAVYMATEADCPGPIVYDLTGQVQDHDWLATNYGAVSWGCTEVADDAGYVYRLVELREACGPATIVVTVRDDDGNPLAGRAVIRGWPGAPALPYYDPPASRYEPYLGVYGFTNDLGDVGFGLGLGDYYWPPEGGASWLYIADYDGPSDLLTGSGMVGETEHCLLRPLWERIAKDDVVPPTVTPLPPDPTDPTSVPPPSGLIRIDEFYIRVSTPEP